MINLIPAAKISSTALDAERTRMDILANNLANAQSIGQDGKVYHRKVAIFESVLDEQLGGNNLGGVKLTEVIPDSSRAPSKMYMPYHPEADEEGMVLTPNISPIEEMVDMMTATKAYEANLSIMKDSRSMADKTIDLLKS